MKYNLKKITDKKSLEFFRQKSDKVESVDKETLLLIDNMYNVLYHNNAIGIAGVMVGALKRIVVIDLQENNRKKPITLINPEIIECSEEIVKNEESSISLDNIIKTINRYKKVKVKYFDVNFTEKVIEADGLLSICLQHEIDYLDGKLFIDYLNDKEKYEIINNIVNDMKIRTILDDIDILRTKCVEVKNIDENVVKILDNMLNIMYENKGVGLAANQVGLNEKLVVIDLQENDIKNPLFLINPEIVWKSKETTCEEEGCLSVPHERAKVVRSKKVKVKYFDKKAKENLIEADDYLAICLQHEIDHLNGKIFIDYLSKLKQDVLIKKIKKFK